jgi:hypothetical protein
VYDAASRPRRREAHIQQCRQCSHTALSTVLTYSTVNSAHIQHCQQCSHTALSTVLTYSTVDSAHIQHCRQCSHTALSTVLTYSSVYSAHIQHCLQCSHTALLTLYVNESSSRKNLTRHWKHFLPGSESPNDKTTKKPCLNLSLQREMVRLQSESAFGYSVKVHMKYVRTYVHTYIRTDRQGYHSTTTKMHKLTLSLCIQNI